MEPFWEGVWAFNLAWAGWLALALLLWRTGISGWLLWAISAALAPASLGAMMTLAPDAYAWNLFGAMQGVAWLAGLHLPAAILASARAIPSRSVRAQAQALALTLAGGALWATMVEPHRLEVTHTEIPVRGLQRPLTVAVIADLQTDDIGPYEAAALLQATAPAPDLLLFPGDYLQTLSDAAYHAQAPRLRALLRTLPPPRLGAFAVEGDMERPTWSRDLFADTPVTPLTEARDLGELWLVGASLAASRRLAPLAPSPALSAATADDRPLLILGHAPDLALSLPRPALMIAGHTHGGQVQLPGFGPLLTFSAVPRAWAAGGYTPLPGGSGLYVSRGVGMERGQAPRVRMFCRPEVALLYLTPA